MGENIVEKKEKPGFEYPRFIYLTLKLWKYFIYLQNKIKFKNCIES